MLIFSNIKKKINHEIQRDLFVSKQISLLKKNSKILDAAAGDSKYKILCKNLIYKSQDNFAFKKKGKKNIFTKNYNFNYVKHDYVGNIWKINEKKETFDAVLCTEVLEHVPYPLKTLNELTRLLKKNGKLILTFPSNSLRHFDPFYYCTGFSDRWAEYHLKNLNYKKITIIPQGDYYSFLLAEIKRSIMINKFSIFFLLPAFIYYFFKKKTKLSINTLCFGYHVVAIKK